jgi:hypothetical protein
MSRGDAMWKLARTLSEKADVPVEAAYDSYGRNRTWELSWRDGPTVATMRRRASAATRNVASIDAKSLRYRRGKTELAIVGAYLAYVLPQPTAAANPPIEALDAHDNTELPSGVDDETWALARFAMAQAGVDLHDFQASDATIRYIAKVGVNGLRLDMALSTEEGRQSDCRPLLPAVNVDVLSQDVHRDLQALLARIQRELIGDSKHRDDPRVQLLAAETTRQLLLDAVTARQRGTAARAMADGIGLGSLSTAIGHAPRTLGMRFGTALDAELAPLVWLRDHATEWAAVCVAAAAAVRAAPDSYFYSGVRSELVALGSADPAGGWRALTGTPGAARRLLAATDKWTPTGAEEALRQLKDLLDAYDNAEPPGRRERALRRPLSASTRTQPASVPPDSPS